MHLLQIAAVMGRFFQRHLLAALAPPGLDLEGALAALLSLSLIYQERSSIPEVAYSFRHVLVQDAIYQALPGRRRAPLHQRRGAGDRVFQQPGPPHRAARLSL